MTGKVVLVASPGGHVDEAFEIAGRFATRVDRFWITARTPQTEVLLAREQVTWVPEVKSREGLRAAQSLSRAFRIMRESRPRLVVSTGAALTVPYMLAASALRLSVTYVESATRLTGPSQTGRIIERVPGVRLYHQGSGWRRGRWQEFGSIFDCYVSQPADSRSVHRVLVTVGSERFSFPRALKAAQSALPDVRLAWQIGNTPVCDAELSGEVRKWWPADELSAEILASDVVITHAGVGTILTVLRSGQCPVVIPRMKQLGEHVDDHQNELAAFLAERELAVVVRPGDDLANAVAAASARRVTRRQ